ILVFTVICLGCERVARDERRLSMKRQATPAAQPPATSRLGRLIPLADLPDSLRHAMAPWIRQWNAVLPGFDRDSVWVDSTRSFRPAYTQARGPAVREIPSIRLGVVWSPDHRRYLNPDFYVEDAARDHGAISIVRDVDSAPMVADLANDSLMT